MTRKEMKKSLLDLGIDEDRVDKVVEDYENRFGALPMGPDTTENIREVVDGDEIDNLVDTIGKYKDDNLKRIAAQGIKNAKTLMSDPKFQEAVGITIQKSTRYTPEDKEKKGRRGPLAATHEVSIFDSILNEMSEVHRKKNNDYGGAAHKGYLEMGMAYYLGIIFNKYQRLKNLTIDNKTQEVKEESIEDTLLDLANYAVLALESLRMDGQK